MRYDLLLQSEDPKTTPYDDAVVNALLAKRELKTTTDGRTLWSLRSGDVEVKPLREGGALLGTELRVPLSDRLELIREVVLEASQLASEAKARLFNPQLGRGLTKSDDGAVADQYLKTAKYAGGLGVNEALGAAFERPKEGFTVTTKMVFVVGGALLLLYLVMNYVATSLGAE